MARALVTDRGNEIVVFAAGSLTDAFSEIGAAVERRHPTTTVAFHFASADHLRQRIEAGERAEVFASADWAQLQAAQREGLLSGEPRAFATNRLTLLVSRANPRDIHSLADLARDGVRIAAEHAEAPLSVYTRALLANLSQDPAFGPALARRLEQALAPTARTVRQIVEQVTDGAADAGIVYVTDVTPTVRPLLATFEIPASLNVTATYAIGTPRTGTHSVAAAQFLEFVRGSVGQQILTRWGFGPAPVDQAG
jgi:molybdate transport system substrate-binding protein